MKKTSNEERTLWRPIWDLDQPGTQLEAKDTIQRDPEDGGAIVFTAGKRYAVVRVHPLRDPPAAIVIDDEGYDNHIEATFLHHFRVVRP